MWTRSIYGERHGGFRIRTRQIQLTPWSNPLTTLSGLCRTGPTSTNTAAKVDILQIAGQIAGLPRNLACIVPGEGKGERELCQYSGSGKSEFQKQARAHKRSGAEAGRREIQRVLISSRVVCPLYVPCSVQNIWAHKAKTRRIIRTQALNAVPPSPLIIRTGTHRGPAAPAKKRKVSPSKYVRVYH